MFKRLLVAFLLTTASVGTALAQESPRMGGVINIVIQPEPPGLMLAMIQNGPTQMVSWNIFEGLLRYSPKLSRFPALRKSCERLAVMPGYSRLELEGVDLGVRASAIAKGQMFNNVEGYSNPDIDRLFAEGAVATPDSKRKEIYEKAQKILVEDVPVA